MNPDIERLREALSWMEDSPEAQPVYERAVAALDAVDAALDAAGSDFKRQLRLATEEIRGERDAANERADAAEEESYGWQQRAESAEAALAVERSEVARLAVACNELIAEMRRDKAALEQTRAALRRARTPRKGATVGELTSKEEHELAMARIAAYDGNVGSVIPFTPAEARFHAHAFIAANGPLNLVRLLAEAYLRDTEGGAA